MGRTDNTRAAIPAACGAAADVPRTAKRVFELMPSAAACLKLISVVPPLV